MINGSLDQWLERLEALHPSEIELGLERVSAVAARLGLLEPKQPVITVAGTNGKGSTVAVLEALLSECNHRVGAYTSPHFLRFNERIRVGGREASDEQIVAAFEKIEESRDEVSLTYFEFATLAALLVFQELECDVLVLEVGLGGRLDAVNILDASVAVITSIDLDHQGWLGDSREEIAPEKAGIVRSGRPVVIADPAPPETLVASVLELGADPVMKLGDEFSLRALGVTAWEGSLSRINGEARELPEMKTGALLPENILAALQATLLLGIEFSDAQLAAALEREPPTGRRQRREIGGRVYLLDVAHNPASIDSLLEYIDITNCNGRKIAIFSPMSDKDLDGMIRRAAGHFDAWFLADQPANGRAATAARLAELLRREGEQMISISKNLRQAFRRAQSVMQEGDQLTVFGSFHTVAAVMPLLDKDARRQ
jgi:dihydrofolate synthase/folylpolyglutamate synthase